MSRIVEGLLTKLPQKDQNLLSMKFLEGLTDEEIGQHFSITRQGASYKIQSTLKKLKTIAEDNDIDLTPDMRL